MTITEEELQRAIQEGIERGVAAASRSRTEPRSSSPSSRSNRQFGQARAEFTGALGDLTGVFNRAGGSVTDFSQDITNLAGRLPGVGGALEFFGGTITGMVGYLEATNATFQSLSKVGAGFNGDLGALRSAAANARMPLDAFANLVGRNSQALAGLGAGVNGGARRFAELSRAMFEDGQVIRGMTNLGYTLEEANEFLLDNATLLRRQAMLEGMGPDQVAQATLRMAENIAFMAEITGESAEQQRQELIDAQRDGKNIAALRRLEAQGLEGVQDSFNEAFSGLAAAGPTAQAYLQDMIQAGAPMSDATRAFAASNSETAAEIARMAATIRSGADAETKRQTVANQATRATTIAAREYVSETNLAAASVGQLSGYGQNVADNIAATENFRLGAEQFRRELAQRRGVDVNAVSQDEASRLYLEEIRNRVGAQTGGGAEGQALSREINIATIALADSAAGVNQEIGRNLSANTELQAAATSGLRGIANIVAGGGVIAQSAVRGLTPGDVDQSRIDESNFRSLFEPLITTNALRTEIVNLPEILSEMAQLAPDQIRAILEAAERERAGTRSMGGTVLAGSSYLVGENGAEEFVPGVNGAIVPNMQNEMASMQRAMETIMPSMRNESISMRSSLTQLASNLRSRLEQTSPNNAAANPTDIIEQVRGAMSGNPDISTEKMEQLLDSLNQSMLQLVNINNTQARNQTRHTNAIKGAGNLLQGVAVR